MQRKNNLDKFVSEKICTTKFLPTWPALPTLIIIQTIIFHESQKLESCPIVHVYQRCKCMYMFVGLRQHLHWIQVTENIIIFHLPVITTHVFNKTVDTIHIYICVFHQDTKSEEAKWLLTSDVITRNKRLSSTVTNTTHRSVQTRTHQNQPPVRGIQIHCNPAWPALSCSTARHIFAVSAFHQPCKM